MTTRPEPDDATLVAADQIDIGRPVEWMIDPNRRGVILGVIYEFSRTGVRRTVWYTANKRRPKIFATVTSLEDGGK